MLPGYKLGRGGWAGSATCENQDQEQEWGWAGCPAQGPLFESWLLQVLVNLCPLIPTPSVSPSVKRASQQIL